jgi:hypothetical protein
MARKKSFIGQYLKHPGPLAKPLTGKRYKRELKAQRRLEFGPEQRQLASEKRAARLTTQRTGDWYDSYLNDLKRLQGQVQGAYAQAGQQVASGNAAQAGYAESLRQRLGTEDRADAKLRGANYDPSQSGTAAQAALARYSTGNTMGGLLATQGANENAYFAAERGIGHGSKVDQLLRARARGRTVNADLRDLASRKRKFAADYASQARPQERDFYLGLLQAKLGKQASKRSAQTSLANAQLSSQTSRANSRRSFEAAMGNLRERVRHDQISESQAAQQEARLRKQFRQGRKEFRLTHTPGGKSRGTVGSGSSSGGVGKAIAELRYHGSTLSPKEQRSFTRQDAIAYLIHAGFDRQTAQEAVRHLLGGGGGSGGPYSGGHPGLGR